MTDIVGGGSRQRWANPSRRASCWRTGPARRVRSQRCTLLSSRPMAARFCSARWAVSLAQAVQNTVPVVW